MDLTDDDVIFIMKLFESSDYEVLDMKVKDFHIHIDRSGGTNFNIQERTESDITRRAKSSAGTEHEPNEIVSTTALPSSPQREESAPTKNIAPIDESAKVKHVRSPLLGTFYRSPSPGAAPFVEVGDVVKIGDPLCLIEVMKTYTTISAEVAGKIVYICAQESVMVEADEVLFSIEAIDAE